MRTSGIPVLSCSLLLTACVTTNATMLDPTAVYPKVCVDAVLVYTSPDKAPTGYKEIALLNSSGSSSETDQTTMITSMRSKAASLGATGVILDNISEPSAGAKLAGAFLGTSAERQGKAVAIYVAADSARVRTVCQAK